MSKVGNSERKDYIHRLGWYGITQTQVFKGSSSCSLSTLKANFSPEAGAQDSGPNVTSAGEYWWRLCLKLPKLYLLMLKNSCPSFKCSFFSFFFPSFLLISSFFPFFLQAQAELSYSCWEHIVAHQCRISMAAIHALFESLACDGPKYSPSPPCQSSVVQVCSYRNHRISFRSLPPHY